MFGFFWGAEGQSGPEWPTMVFIISLLKCFYKTQKLTNFFKNPTSTSGSCISNSNTN